MFASVEEVQERFRASQFGIRHLCTLALNPKEANDPRVAAGVVELLPRYLGKDGVVAVGEIGFDDVTPDEERWFAAQLELAREHELPVLVHTPHRDKTRGTERSLALLREHRFPEERVLVDHNTEETMDLVRAYGCWAGLTVYPLTKLSPERAANILETWGVERVMVNSSADWGVSDPLSVPRVVLELRKRGWPEEKIQPVVWDTPRDFYKQSGRLKPPTV